MQPVVHFMATPKRLSAGCVGMRERSVILSGDRSVAPARRRRASGRGSVKLFCERDAPSTAHAEAVPRIGSGGRTFITFSARPSGGGGGGRGKHVGKEKLDERNNDPFYPAREKIGFHLQKSLHQSTAQVVFSWWLTFDLL